MYAETSNEYYPPAEDEEQKDRRAVFNRKRTSPVSGVPVNTSARNTIAEKSTEINNRGLKKV